MRTSKRCTRESKGHGGLIIGSPEWSKMSLEFAGVEEDDARSPRLLQDRRGKKVTEEQSSKNMMT
jgi:hypothetical protein